MLVARESARATFGQGVTAPVVALLAMSDGGRGLMVTMHCCCLSLEIWLIAIKCFAPRLFIIIFCRSNAGGLEEVASAGEDPLHDAVRSGRCFVCLKMGLAVPNLLWHLDQLLLIFVPTRMSRGRFLRGGGSSAAGAGGGPTSPLMRSRR